MSDPSSIIHPSSSDQADLFAVPPIQVSGLWLENLLKGAACWMSARDIELTTRGVAGDREIRKLASASEKIVSGDRGYKHIEHATTDEIDHCSNRLVSQGKKMIRRGIAIRRNGHALLG